MGELGADLWVLSKFKNGFYVDVGCADAEEYSNTLLLEKKGWNGICIDAFPRNFHSRNCTVEQICLGSEDDRDVEFLLGKHEQNLSGILSGLTEEYKDRIVQTGHEILRIKTVTLEKVLDKHKAPKFIEYLNLDIEGGEYDVLRTFPFEKYTFGCISVEHNFQEPKRTLIRNLLESKGYMFEKEVKWDDWFVRRPPEFIFEKCISGDQCQVIEKHVDWSKVRTVLEIGFGAGHSSRYFLSRGPGISVTSFEMNQRDYTLREKKLIDENFPGRHEMIWGDSQFTLPKFGPRKFDLIFIDGSHDFDICRRDIAQCMRLADDHTLVIVPDVSYEDEWTVKYTLGVTRAWQEFVQISVIQEMAREREVCIGRYLLKV
jgi:predicted O-methyltransferase YrrM